MDNLPTEEELAKNQPSPLEIAESRARAEQLKEIFKSEDKGIIRWNRDGSKFAVPGDPEYDNKEFKEGSDWDYDKPPAPTLLDKIRRFLNS